MDLHTVDEEIFALETQLSLLESTPRLAILIPLAWHLRQRDCQRALALTVEAKVLLKYATNDQDWYRRNIARIELIQSEIYWLFGELEAAERDAAQALQTFEDLQDGIGIGDAHFLLTSIHRDLGQIKERDLHLHIAIDRFKISGDIERHQIALARNLHNNAIRNPQNTSILLNSQFDLETRYPQSVNAWLASARAIIANKIGDLGESCRLHIQAHRAAFESGQIRLAILAATNAGDSFATLGDLDAALEWDEIALENASNNNWPSSLATALLQTGNALRLLERHADAKEKLLESLSVQDKISGSRTFAHTLCYLGDLSLDLGVADEALNFFELAAEKIAIHDEPVFLADCWRGQAIAHCRIGNLKKAKIRIDEAMLLARAHHNLDEQIKCLRVCAEISKKSSTGSLNQVELKTQCLQYLLEALALCTSINAYLIPADLLDEIADNYAEQQEFQTAFHFVRLAASAKENRRLNEARNRATAMQVRYDNERHRAEAEHHRRIANTEAERAQSLQESSNTLETLGLIGREITANLNTDSVFESLHRHVNDLLDASSFGISLLEAGGDTLRFVFGVEHGVPIPSFSTPLSHPVSSFARCARERQEIVFEHKPGATGRFIVPGTLETLSLLYTPLMVGDRLLGVMSIQSTRAHVYGERERSILRTLAAYGAIALDNALAYKQLQATLATLRETQNQLEEVSITDPLTGLRNRRFLLQHIESDVARALRAYEDQLSSSQNLHPCDEDIVFFMVDLDHFKSVNDTYGHACGDMVLMQIKDRLKDVFRESDYLIRWGGEEFLVVARTCNRADAGIVAERIRQVVSSTPFSLIDEIKISRTCSVGFACYPFDPQQPSLLTWSQVVNFADQALYMVKNAGRNACIGIMHSDRVRSDDVYHRVMRHPQQAADAHFINLVSHKIQDLDDAISAS
jgi:diguanylate cyclase (GGDEF)-like protein